MDRTNSFLGDVDPNAKIALLIKQIDREIIRNEVNEESKFSIINRRDILLGILVETIVSDFDINISHERTNHRVYETIEDMISESNTSTRGYTDPVCRFRDDWPELTSDGREHRFTVLIPLPLWTKPNGLPKKVNIDGREIRRTDPKTWRGYNEEANKSNPVEGSNYPASVTEFISSTDVEPISVNEYTFWIFDMIGGDADFVLRELESVLETFLGQLNFTTHQHNRFEYKSERNRIRRSGRRVIEHPPMYLVFKDDEFCRLQPKNTQISRPIPELRREERFDNAMQLFPDLSSFDSVADSKFIDDSSVVNASIEAQLAACFRTLRKALTTSDPETTLLSLYRTLEHVTFTKHSESSEPLNRALRLIDATTDEYLQEMTFVLKNRRNKLVHEGTDVGITVNNLNLLKDLSFVSMNSLSLAMQEYSRNDIITYITTDVGSVLDDLITERNELDAQIDRLRDLNEWDQRIDKL
jgi:hypothetical protein